MPAPAPIPPDLQKRLYAAVLSDVLDGMGLREQAMKPFVRPLDEDSVLFGRARTGLYMPVYEVREGENPYEIEIALVDDLKPGDVAVFSCGGRRIASRPGASSFQPPRSRAAHRAA